MRWGRLLAAGTALGLAGLLGLRVALQRQLPAQLLRAELEKSLGFPVRYQSFQLSWDAKLRLHQVELLDTEGRPFLKVAEAELDFDRGQALEGKPVLLRLLLEHPDVEMSGQRWRKLSQRPSRPAARTFPLLLHSLDLRWLDDQGGISWQVRDWQGSFPPVPMGQWKVGLQGPQGESVDAEGASGKVHLRLQKFPVATLATVATGAHYPSLEQTANVDLEAQGKDGSWDLKANLRSAAFTGPIQLQLGAELHGQLSSPGGQLYPLGEVKQLRLSFTPTGQGWKIEPASLQWRGIDWQMDAQIEGEDRFSGHLLCSRWPLPEMAGWQAQPARLEFKVKGSARRQQADFQALARLPQVRWAKRSLGEWTVTATGRLQSDGLPKVDWALAGPQGRWPGRLAWNAVSGDLQLSFLPLNVARFLPGWKGLLSGQLRRRGKEAWDLRLELPLLQSPGSRIESARLLLGGTPPQWSGGAVCDGVPVTLLGPLEQPRLEGKVEAGRWKTKEWTGQANLRLALTPQHSLRLELLQHDLRWRGTLLPQLQGAVLGDEQGLKSEHLQLVWPAFKLPLTATGSWDPKSWKVTGQLKSQPILGLLTSLGMKATGFEGAASGELLASGQQLKWTGELKGLKLGGHGLSPLRVTLSKSLGKPAQASLSSSALMLPGGVPVGESMLTLAWSPQGMVRLSGKLGRASLQGWLKLDKRTLELSGKLDKLSIVGLPGVPFGCTGWLTGQWRVGGAWTAPQLELKGQLNQLKLLNSSLGDLPLQFRRAGTKNLLSIGPVRLQQLEPLQQKLAGLKGDLQLSLVQQGKVPSQLSARLTEASYQDHALSELSVEGQWKNNQLENAQILWQLTPPLKLVGTVGLSSRLSGTLQGQSLASISLGILPLQGQAFGNVTCGDGFSFAGEVRKLSAAGQNLGQGRLTVEYKERLRVTGQEFDAGQVGLLQQRYPGLQGQLSFEVDSDLKQHQGTLKLRSARWNQRPFPDLTVEATSEAESWTLARVEVALNPPLQSSGRMWPSNNRLELGGKLEGQGLADLTLLGGGSPPPDVSTQLYGDYQLATQPQFHLAFRGQTRQLTYRGVNLGDGQLQLSADPELQGELILQQPMEISSLANVPEGLKAVLPVSQFLSALRLRGVRLGGRLDSPSVTPLWATPQFRLPFP